MLLSIKLTSLVSNLYFIAHSTAEKDKAYRDEVKRKNEEKAKSKAAFREKLGNFQ